MLANYIHSRCVNPCLPVFLSVGISIHRQIVSNLNKTSAAALKVWSCPFFNEQDQIAISRASLQQADKPKFTTSVLMVHALIETMCSKQWAVATFLPVKKCDALSPKRIFNVVEKKRDSSMD